MSVEEGIDSLIEQQVGEERGNALAEVRDCTLTPTEPMTFGIGKQEVNSKHSVNPYWPKCGLPCIVIVQGQA